jgi:glycosyltransferase involved in cell wall biosynthesis
MNVSNKLSIITINLNNAAGLQKTMQSVFEQSFKEVEYIVIDGESNDGSVALIEKYKHQLSYWVSEPDKGVYHAMNKGIQKATGGYLLFLNSGDYLVDENVLTDISAELGNTGIVYGDLFIRETEIKTWMGVYPAKLSFTHFAESSLPHPASFIQRALFDKVGMYDESLAICADWKFFMDAICLHNCSYKKVNRTVAAFSLDGMSSTGNSVAIIREEKERALWEHYPLFMETYREMQALKSFKNHRLVNVFAKIAGAVGLIKNQ